MATYYVDATNGSDSANGTSDSTPWRTISRANDYSRNSETETVFQAGDSILFKRGEVWREKLMITKCTGTSSNARITFGAYGDGDDPIICGSDKITGWTETSPGSCVWQASAPWVNPYDLDVNDLNCPAPDLLLVNGDRGIHAASLGALAAPGDWFWAASTLSVYSEAEPTDIELPARSRCIMGTNNSNASYITIRDLELKNGLHHCLTVTETCLNWTVYNVTAHHSGRLDPATTNAIDKNGICVTSADGFTLSNCTVYEAGANNIQIEDSSDVLIEHCTTWNGHHHCIDMKGGASDPSGNVIRYNTVFVDDLYSDPYTPNGICLVADDYPDLTDVLVYGNVVYDIHENGGGGGNGFLMVGSTFAGIQVFNNTIVDCYHAFYIDDSASDTVIKNNIGATFTPEGSWSPVFYCIGAIGNKIIDYNCWYRNPLTDFVQANHVPYSTLSAWQMATGQDANSIAADPLFVDVGGLDSGSPCENTGAVISGYSSDRAGTAIPQGSAPDMGAYEISLFSLTYSAVPGGSIDGDTEQQVSSGQDGTEVTALPATGYRFVQWSDDVMTAARTDLNVQANITVSASFALNQYTLTYTANAGGAITGTSPQTVNQGANGTLVTAVPDPTYHFTSWSDGVLTAARKDLALSCDITVTATFAIDTVTLTYRSGTGGHIVGTTPQTVDYGGDGTEVVATPNEGYTFAGWSDDPS